MRYSYIRTPIYMDDEHSAIYCKVLFKGFDNPIPFHAISTDLVTHGQGIYARLIAGASAK